MKKKIGVIGAGFSSLSTASYLAKAGHEVHIFEKNSSAGGRARQFKEKGFTFDMGPSWYWMPEVFENFYNDFGYKTEDFYELKRLDPSYQVIFSDKNIEKIPAKINQLIELFDKYEKGGGKQLRKFLNDAAYKYEVGMGTFVNKPSLSIFELINWQSLKASTHMSLLSSFSKFIRKYFKSEELLLLLEFPVLFLGAMPNKIPALYSLMNYADMQLGTWYPMGGMHKIVEAMSTIAYEQGVKIHLNANVTQINTTEKTAKSITVNDKEYLFDIIIGAGDYHHIEQKLLPKAAQNYSAAYWEKRTMAPSSVLYYVGLNKKIKNIEHHNLFFNQSMNAHAKTIYEQPSWIKKPLFYMCCPSQTDASVAPKGHENLFILIPSAAGLDCPQKQEDYYFDYCISEIEKLCGENIKNHIIYKRSYSHRNFIEDYNAFKGNAYGLANTLKQTAIFKPSIKNKKLNNLYFTGQLTVPGPGVPPSIISGRVVANHILKHH